jgi:hypothetical protein
MELLKNLTGVDREFISADGFYEQRFVFEIPKLIPAEDLNSQISEANHPQLSH